VTVNAIAREFLSDTREFAALLGLMTGQADGREICGIPLCFVNIVAGCAGQSLRQLEAAALTKKFDLIAVNVDGIGSSFDGKVDVVAQVFSGQKRECRREWDADPRMA